MAMAVNNVESSMEYFTRFQTLRAQTEASESLTMKILIYCERIENERRSEVGILNKKIEDLSLDLDDAIRARRELQRQLDSCNQKLEQISTQNEYLKNSNPYVLVLIDGDGLLFNEEYIRQGIEGGKKAANALRSAVLRQYSDLPENTEVKAKVLCNVQGLMKAMHRDGCLEKAEDWKDFTIGFSRGKTSFDFVDVGYGKERADQKIQATTQWNLRNANCKQILLGISHDGGYAPFLDQILHDDESFCRVSIIEGCPIARELSATNLPKVSFPEIFRSEKLITRYQTDSPATTSLTSLSTPSSYSASYAGVISHGTPPPPTPPTKLSFPIKAFTPSVKEVVTLPVISPSIQWNPGFRGLDEPITVNKDVLDKIKNRATTSKKKLCNNHYLRGPSGCFKGADCPFEHNAKVNAEEMKAIQYLTRLNPCTSGQDCELEFCIYGHHCPSTVNGVCEQWLCRFSKDEHPPGTVIKHPKRRDTDY